MTIKSFLCAKLCSEVGVQGQIGNTRFLLLGDLYFSVEEEIINKETNS